MYVPSWGPPATSGALSGAWCPSMCGPDANPMSPQTVSCAVNWRGLNATSHASLVEKECGGNQSASVGWYKPQDGQLHYQGDVQATLDFGFSSIKLDACGIFRNMTYWAELFNATGRQVMIEDCHFGRDGPGDWGDGGHLNRGPNAVPKEKWYRERFLQHPCEFDSDVVWAILQVPVQLFPHLRRHTTQLGSRPWKRTAPVHIRSSQPLIESMTSDNFDSWNG